MKAKKTNKKNKQNTEAKIATKKIKSTLDWLQVEKVNEYHMDIVSGKKHEVALGIKLEPHSLFLDNPSEQKRRIHLLRSSLNRLAFDIWHGFVFNPVNLDTHLVGLMKQANSETDKVIKEMIEDDIEKAMIFIQNYRELEFFMIIKGKPGKKTEDSYHQLKMAMTSAKFQIKPLNRIDFDNYIAFAFENELVNDFYFSKGVFADPSEEYGHDVHVDTEIEIQEEYHA